jgi:hypothetical protein
MKIIQSYWSFPDQTNSNQRQLVGSHLNKMIFMTLSCLKLKEVFSEVELYTDQAGKELFIDQLNLPYTRVHVVLDDLTREYGRKKSIWALGKIYAYQQQTGPFLHVDNDVFIWKKFSEDLLKQPIIAQSYEMNNGHHKANLYSSVKTLDYIPEVILENIRSKHDGGQYNAGIIGGCDIEFFQNFTKEAFSFVDKNLDKLNSLPKDACFPCLFEQYLFSVMAQEKKKTIATLLPLPKIPSDNFKNLVEISDRYRTNFVHLVGDHKKEYYNTSLISEILWLEYPEYHFKIFEIYGKSMVAN